MGTDGSATEVDLDQVKAAKAWLERARDEVVAAIHNLAPVPGMVGNAAVNANDNNDSHPGQAPAPLMTTATTGALPAGLLDEVGPTHFGFFSSGLEVAKKHATAYNSTLTGLSTVLKGLNDTLSATDYIIVNYQQVESDSLANFQQLLTNPPYDPGAAADPSMTQIAV